MYLILISLLLFNTSNIPNFRNMADTMYLGVENTIIIDLNGCDQERMEIKVDGGSLLKRSDSLYIYVPQNTDTEVKFKLYYKKVLCAVKIVQIKKIPDPILVLESENQGFIRLKDLANPGKLTFIYPPLYPENNKSKVISFSILMNDKTGNPIYSTTIRGDQFDENILNQVKNLTPGATITISNIITQNIYQGNSLLQVNKQITIVK